MVVSDDSFLMQLFSATMANIPSDITLVLLALTGSVAM